MLISIDDFPTVPEDIDALEAAIAQAEALVQGDLGANRSLEITQYVEVHPMRSAIYPQMSPLISVSKVWVKGGFMNGYGLPNTISDWQEIPASNYSIDLDYGEIRLMGVHQISRRYPASVKVQYQSGFDFEDDSPIIRAMKSSMIAIAIELSNQVVASNVKSFEIDDEGHKTTYFGGNEGLSLSAGTSKIGTILAGFRKYRGGGERFA